MNVFAVVWRNRHWLVEIARVVEALIRAGRNFADIRRLVAQRISDGRLLSDDALIDLYAANDRRKGYLRGS